MRKFSLIFIYSLVLNIVWEFLHSVLYTSYMGKTITGFILVRAAVWDAVIITLVCIPFLWFSSLQKRSWLLIPIGIVIAIAIEYYALHTGRWTYAPSMPIIPLLNMGLTPILQLGITGYVSYLISHNQ